MRYASFDLWDGSSKILGGDSGSALTAGDKSLARGRTESLVYLGGSYKIPDRDNEWKLALVKLPVRSQKFIVTTLG